jgi:hypothetical protein
LKAIEKPNHGQRTGGQAHAKRIQREYKERTKANQHQPISTNIAICLNSRTDSIFEPFLIYHSLYHLRIANELFSHLVIEYTVSIP